jgi:hypothetical protein
MKPENLKAGMPELILDIPSINFLKERLAILLVDRFFFL